MTSAKDLNGAHMGFASFIELQQENLNLLEAAAEHPADGKEVSPNEDGIRAFVRHAAATGAILDKPAERRAAQAAIDYWTTSLILSRSRSYASQDTKVDEQYVLAPFDANLSPDLSHVKSPYKGLDPFERGDADDFFGREDAKTELFRRLEKQSFVLLQGPAGSGKSSLINAGLLPELERSNLGKTYKLLPVIIPGREPLAAILRAIKPNAGNDEIKSEERMIDKSPAKLGELISRTCGKAILILDQFGDTMSRADIRTSLDKVGEALASCIKDNKILICIRDNQRRQFEKIASIGKLTESPESRFQPPAPTAQELRNIIEKPAERVGLRFANGIVDDLAKSVFGNPDALPLLQFALINLWKHRQRNEVTVDAYRTIGSPRNALTGTADAVFNSLSPDDKELARKLFLKLVTPCGDDEFIRNRLGREALSVGEDGNAVDRVLEAFEDANLLRKIVATDNNERFEVAHDTLIAYWPTLASWLGDLRQEMQTETRLVAMARLWLESGRGKGYLISGRELGSLKNYHSNSSEVQQLLDASHSKRKQDRIVSAAALLSIVVIVSAAFWFYQKQNKEIASAENDKKKAAEGLREDYTVHVTRMRQTVDNIKQAVSESNQTNLRIGLSQLGIAQADVNKVTIFAKSKTDEELQAAVSVPVPISTPPSPLPSPKFDTNTGECPGVMWLGSKSNWQLKTPASPDKLMPGPAIVKTNINLRSGFPSDSPAYEMSPSFGLVLTDTPIEILEAPRIYQRPTGPQYWAEVRVPRKVCAKVYIQYAGKGDAAGDATGDPADTRARELALALGKDNFRSSEVPEKLSGAAGLSEVRYFHKADEKLADELKRTISEFSKKEVSLRPLLNWSSGKVPLPATLEVWIDLSDVSGN